MTSCAATICQTAGTLAVSEVVTITGVGIIGAAVANAAVLTNTASAFTDGVTPDPNRPTTRLPADDHYDGGGVARVQGGVE
ncbi:MAG: hypothetical protein IPM07_21360 [Anaerolineales bacterium]|nr:hypothetical protein [Anaerolineales bacterium]